MTRYRVADLCQRHVFIALLQALSKASDFGLAYDTIHRCHFACFKATVWGRDWMLHVPVTDFEIDRPGMFALIDIGNRMIQDVEAFYRQQSCAR